MTDKFHYTCNDCGAEYSSEQVIYLCTVCNPKNRPDQPPKGVLKTLYNYTEIRNRVPSAKLFTYLQN